ncbi:MAG: hypothetical protein GX813_03365 [Erysipelotrichia bacterium]|nr:hypothetical protein [Erysipelotrichia bacterium]
MIEEVKQIEKNNRKNRAKNRLLWFLIVCDLALLGWLIYEVVRIVNTLMAS